MALRFSLRRFRIFWDDYTRHLTKITPIVCGSVAFADRARPSMLGTISTAATSTVSLSMRARVPAGRQTPRRTRPGQICTHNVRDYVKTNHPGAVVATNPGGAGCLLLRGSRRYPGDVRKLVRLLYESPPSQGGCGPQPLQTAPAAPDLASLRGSEQVLAHGLQRPRHRLDQHDVHIQAEQRRVDVHDSTHPCPILTAISPITRIGALSRGSAAPSERRVQQSHDADESRYNGHQLHDRHHRWSLSSGPNGVVAYDIYQSGVADNGGRIWSVPPANGAKFRVGRFGRLLRLKRLTLLTVRARDAAGLQSAASAR